MFKCLLRKKIKNIVLNSERKKVYHNLTEIKTVLVLFDTENFDDANDFIQQLKKMEKKVKAIAFKNKRDAKTYSNISYTVVTEKDMRSDSLTQILNTLVDETFDLVVDLTLKENLTLQYIYVSTISPLKIGFYKHALPIHDIVISFAPGLGLTVKELGAQLIHYLTIISSATRGGE